VAEKRLDVADVRAVLVHQRSHRGAEQVARSALAQLGVLDAALTTKVRWSLARVVGVG